MKKMLFTVLFLLICAPCIAQQDCPSTTTLNIKSSTYSGKYYVELRRGTRPGSKVVAKRDMRNNETVEFQDICPGTHFYSFGTPDSDQISVTRYFEVKYDGETYNNPTITVYYTRSNTEGSQRLVSVKKRDL